MSLSKSLSFALASFACACGSAESGPSPAPGPAERTVAEEQAQDVQQALGEASCGATAADTTWNDPYSNSIGPYSPDANYDHPTCRNAFIVDATSVKAGATLSVMPFPVDRSGNPFTCLFTFGYIGLWQKQGTTYVKVTESLALGVLGSLPMIGSVCAVPSRVRVPADGDYRLVTSAGTFFVGYSRVSMNAS